MSSSEYEKTGVGCKEMGNLKKTKSSTQFLDGPISTDSNIADLASATLPKTPPALSV
jgi:hypothetical protein